jgi:hypothetical protein
MDNLLANQSGATLTASAPPRSLNRRSLALLAKRRAASSCLSSRKASPRVGARLTASRIGAPNTSAKKTPGTETL